MRILIMLYMLIFTSYVFSQRVLIDADVTKIVDGKGKTSSIYRVDWENSIVSSDICFYVNAPGYLYNIQFHYDENYPPVTGYDLILNAVVSPGNVNRENLYENPLVNLNTDLNTLGVTGQNLSTASNPIIMNVEESNFVKSVWGWFFILNDIGSGVPTKRKGHIILQVDDTNFPVNDITESVSSVKPSVFLNLASYSLTSEDMPVPNSGNYSGRVITYYNVETFNTNLTPLLSVSVDCDLPDPTAISIYIDHDENSLGTRVYRRVIKEIPYRFVVPADIIPTLTSAPALSFVIESKKNPDGEIRNQ